MIRTPNRGVSLAGAALGTVSLAAGVLGVSGASSARASAATAAVPRAVVVAPNSDSSTTLRAVSTARTVQIDAQVLAAERASLSGQAAEVAAAAGSTKTKAPKPKKKASRAKKRAPLTPREMAQQLVADRGWKPAEFTCLNKLWTRESNWQVHEENGGSGAYGIPQSLPGRKMASFGADWRDNPLTQIRWGLWYIADRYSTPCAAWAHSERYNYY